MSRSTGSFFVITEEEKEAKMMIRMVLLLFLVGVCRSAPTSVSSTSSPRRSPDQEVGSPSELAWQAWLLVNTETGAHSGIDSSSILRRITPKSVFIAPALPACAEGYGADNMGRCVNDITRRTYIDVLVQKLNAMYSSSNTANEKPQSSAVTGPLQLNIPLLPGGSQEGKTDGDDAEEPAKMPVEEQPEDKKEALVTVYEVGNETKHQKEETFFLGSSEKDAAGPTTTDIVVPVADFVDDANETFTDVMDYKIRSDTQLHTNRTEISKDESSMNSTDVPLPTLMLVLSPTKLPLTVSTPNVNDLHVVHDGTSGHIFVKTENVTVNSSGKEIISVTVPDALVHLPSVSGNHTLDIYDDEEKDVLDSTDVPEEDSTEVDDEILKHGEAGMAIPLDQQMYQKSEETGTRKNLPDTAAPEKLVLRNLTQPQRGNEPSASERDEISSNVSSEVSIKGDFIVETTLLGMNTNSSRTSSRNRTCDFGDCDDFRELLEAEKDLISEPEVVLSPQESRGTVYPNIHDKKRAEQQKLNPPSRIQNTGSYYSGSPGQSEALLYDSRPQDPYPDGDSAPEIHTIDEQASYNRESLAFPEVKEPNHFSRPNVNDNYGFRPNPGGYRPNQDYIRFPNYEEPQPQPVRTSGYVRFPSEEANSIHAQDYKNRSPHLEDFSQSSTSTKSSVPIHQKQSYWWLPSGWRADRQQNIQHPSQYPNQRQKPSPMLLRFWARMPLLRDPSLYPSPSPASGSYGETIRSHQMRYSQALPHRTNFYKEMSTQDVNRVLTQKSRGPVVG
ncbi:uncharacterized protein LOC107273936 [Cephus cinctus]|uniref:Uncharacterized protein LOC107273936 n=1 Tax=Cephus cinctus TaxID=211228 RepID=A0AAJ7FTX4_CEPCN|nr:uncharacterized protein LOC107273936 [Cephus cinctus]XP_015608085.1 uncharacterized protein LOC107273936 [Cephus cinctus]XP_015608086.1 uncharacterized protein LOC107273936 [Cephus cinctus]XP_015608087.1 uncharacterized protein LOC107273936 [Cephus cinctus]XP_015608088.1 uncharacterized protein LOC107273936 [Cephus cinctus]XP_024947029.1 uncharacterized protein LOC107273936 [Cephus cinctus]XP_024947030.1 uncharacterized protein LOC107273936 [Cephus cinctus]